MVLQDLLLPSPVSEGMSRHFGANRASCSSEGLALPCQNSNSFQVAGWSCLLSCLNVHPHSWTVMSLLQLTQEQWCNSGLVSHRGEGLGCFKYPKHQIDFSFSLWPAILTSRSYKSPGLLIISITHLTELLTGFPVGIERKNFFSLLVEQSPQTSRNVGPGQWHCVTSIGPSHFGYLPEHMAKPCTAPQPFQRELHIAERTARKRMPTGSALMYLLISRGPVVAGTASAAVASLLCDLPHCERNLCRWRGEEENFSLVPLAISYAPSKSRTKSMSLPMHWVNGAQ